MVQKWFVVGLAVCAAGCGSAGVGQLVGAAANVGVAAATTPSASHASTVHYGNELALAKWRFANLRATTTLAVADAAPHVRGRAVRFVRIGTAHRVEWLDECAVSGATYGELRPVEDWRRRTLALADEVDLFERAPALDAAIGASLRRGRTVRVDLAGTTVRTSTATVARTDLRDDACLGATHVVSAIHYGALRINVDPSPRASERELDAQKEMEVGVFAACPDGDGCAEPIEVTVTPLG